MVTACRYLSRLSKGMHAWGEQGMGLRYIGCAEPDEQGGGCWVVLRRHQDGHTPSPGSCRNGPRPRKLTCFFHAKHEDDAQEAKVQHRREVTAA